MALLVACLLLVTGTLLVTHVKRVFPYEFRRFVAPRPVSPMSSMFALVHILGDSHFETNLRERIQTSCFFQTDSGDLPGLLTG